MMPMADVCVATGAALTGASPPVLSSEAAAGAEDGTSANAAAMACGAVAGAARPRRRTGGAEEVSASRVEACRTVVRPSTPPAPPPRRQPGTAAQSPRHPEPAAAARVGACAASMSADAAPNTVFVRNLPFNVSDEQVRCRCFVSALARLTQHPCAPLARSFERCSRTPGPSESALS